MSCQNNIQIYNNVKFYLPPAWYPCYMGVNIDVWNTEVLFKYRHNFFETRSVRLASAGIFYQLKKDIEVG